VTPAGALVVLAAVHAAEAAAAPDRARPRLRLATAAAANDVAREVHAWLRAQPDPAAPVTARRHAAALAALAVAFAALARVAPALAAAVLAATATARGLARRHLAAQLALLGAAPAPALPLVAAPVAAAVPAAARVADAAAADLRTTLALGAVRGETLEALAVRLRARVGTPGAPRAAALDAPAERLLRTEVAEAYNAAAAAELERAAAVVPDLMRRWDATADAAVCPVCRDLHGVVVAIGEAFPGGYDRPPAHPNCRCTLTAWRAGWGAAAA